MCPAILPTVDFVVLEDMYVNVKHTCKYCHIHLTFRVHTIGLFRTEEPHNLGDGFKYEGLCAYTCSNSHSVGQGDHSLPEPPGSQEELVGHSPHLYSPVCILKLKGSQAVWQTGPTAMSYWLGYLHPTKSLVNLVSSQFVHIQCFVKNSA